MDITPFLDQLDESLKDKVLQLQKGRLVCDAPCRRLWGSQDLVVPQCSPACCSRIQQSPAGSDLGAAALCASVLGRQKGFGFLCCWQWGCECMLCLFHVSPRSPALLLDATLESTPPEEGSVSSSCFSGLGCCYRIDGSWLLSAFHLMLSVIPLVWLCSPRAPSLRSVLCSCAFLAPQQGLGGSQAEAAQRKAPSPCALAVSSFLTWISSCFSAPAIRKLSVRSCRKSWIKSWR